VPRHVEFVTHQEVVQDPLIVTEDPASVVYNLADPNGGRTRSPPGHAAANDKSLFGKGFARIFGRVGMPDIHIVVLTDHYYVVHWYVSSKDVVHIGQQDVNA
jgi:hypothetical protein